MPEAPTVDEVISDEIPAPAPVNTEEAYVPADLDFGLTAEIEARENEEITEDDVAEVEAAAAAELEPEMETEAEVEAEDPEDPEEEEDLDPPDIAAETATEVEEEKTPTLAKKKAPKKQMVPKARLDEVLQKQRDLQKKLDEMQTAVDMRAEAQAAEPEVPEYDFEEKELQYQEMVLDGESKQAAALRQEIRKAERDQLRAEMKAEMSETVGQDRIATAMQQAANQISEAFPVFNSDSEEYDQGLTNEVIALRDAFITQGAAPVEALGKAATYVIKANDMYDGAEADLGSTEAQIDEVAKKRRNTKKKIRVQGQQPPDMPTSSSTTSNDVLDIDTMTDAEFESLPESTLKRLRGDII